MTVCPDCKGAKRHYVHLKHQDSKKSGWQWTNCRVCLGTGEVGEDEAERIEAGRKLREDRVSRGVSLREEAERLQISPVGLNAREHGRLEPPYPDLPADATADGGK